MCIINFKCCSALSHCCCAAAYLAISVSALDLPFCISCCCSCLFFVCAHSNEMSLKKIELTANAKSE